MHPNEDTPQQNEAPPKDTKLTIPIAIVVAGALIALALFLSGGSAKKDVVGVEVGALPIEEINLRSLEASDHILGSPNAALTLVEYSDTECPFCKRFHITLHETLEKYGKTGEVAWVYRHFPLEQLHQKAKHEAVAVECAAELGGEEKFWEYLDELYRITPSNDGLNEAELSKIAQRLGLTLGAFNKCLAEDRYLEKVNVEYAGAIEAGGRGTPFVVVVVKEKLSEERMAKIQTASLNAMKAIQPAGAPVSDYIVFDPSGERYSFSGAMPLSVIGALIEATLQ